MKMFYFWQIFDQLCLIVILDDDQGVHALLWSSKVALASAIC